MPFQVLSSFRSAAAVGAGWEPGALARAGWLAAALACLPNAEIPRGVSRVQPLLAGTTRQQVLRSPCVPLSASATRVSLPRAACPDENRTRVSSAVGVLPTSRGKHGILESYGHSPFFFFLH